MDQYEKSKILTKRYKKIKKLLNIIYGYDSFRPHQYQIINRVINGEDVCAVQPTGAGKSICFQIPALYLDKTALVITPLIALMDDQRFILKELGISSCCYNSQVQNKMQLRNEILQGKYKFVYITPESATSMKDFFVKLHDQSGISLIAIDEAHCISSYGFDFRKAYREITFFKEILPMVPILALTATATQTVAEDICRVLGFNHIDYIQSSFDRPNLYIKVDKKNKKIDADIIPLLKKHDGKCIIYCLTKKETVKIADILKAHKIKCGIYYSDLDADEKCKTHVDFIKNNIRVVACTLAFGMGINIPDIRMVIHYGSPKTIEGYYQEIGRAGRDGKKSYCYTFYGEQDFMMQKSFIADCRNEAYQQVQTKMLERIMSYMRSRRCRRQIILEYFGDIAPDNCGFCDNCCNDHNNKLACEIQTTQIVEAEAKMLINLVESLSPRAFGILMYIDILRGSASKKITADMKKNSYYGKGKHRSIVWWKEMSENLIGQGFLQTACLRGGGFMRNIIKTTKKGINWATMSELGELFGDFNENVLEPMVMNNPV